jgi:hypothetical protein
VAPDNITALYSGDSNYGPSSATAPVALESDITISATLTFSSTAVDQSDQASGQFTYDCTSNTLQAFSFVRNYTSNGYSGTFTYGLRNLNAFTYNCATNVLTFSAGPVSSTNSIFYPEYFYVTDTSGAETGQAATEDFPTVPIETAAVVVTVVIQ